VGCLQRTGRTSVGITIVIVFLVSPQAVNVG